MTLEFADPALNGGASRLMDPAFRAHYFTILRLCMRQLGDRSDAEDAAQETFRRALQQREGMIGDPLPWLIAVARNVCIDELRRRKTGRGALERTAARSNEARVEGENAENPERVVIGRMFVNELLRQLTPAERRVVAGTIVDGQCGGELAASLGVTASTARVLLARARGKLRRYLEDGQGAVPAICFAGWRAAHRMRQRFSGGALLPRPELLLPALVITAVASSTGAPAVAGAGAMAGGDIRALTALRLDGAGDAVSRGAESGATGSLVWAATPGAAPAASAPTAEASHAPSPLDLLIPPADPEQVGVTDFEPSPDYASDHTIYMLGNGNCGPHCGQMFRSTDHGATWTFVPTKGLSALTLLVPTTGYRSGRMYGNGDFLQYSNDGGATFQDFAPMPGFVTAAPAWLGADLVDSETALTFIDGGRVPHVAAVYDAGDAAVSPPLLFPSAGGFVALQLVQNNIVGGPDTLLRCTAAGCVDLAQLPMSGNAQLIASPDFASDHTLVALGAGVAVSHDGGASFTLVSTRAVSDALTVAGPAGPRLVAIDAAPVLHKDLALLYSDDWGRTWSTAAARGVAAHGSDASIVRMIAPGLLIASAIDDTHTDLHEVVCSSDGSSWTTCS